MVFHSGRRKCLGDAKLFVDNIKINETTTMKCLGGIIDTEQNWISHSTFVKKIANIELEFLERPDHC